MEPESAPDTARVLLPKRPQTLPELTEATLDALRDEPRSANIVLGGGVALQHYDHYRETQDIDAWWKEARDPETLERVQAILQDIGRKFGYEVSPRQFGTTDSFEFKRAGSSRKFFSFQISTRDVSLEEPLFSDWSPLLIETFRENIGAKMNALVNRGAPRDLLDIYQVVTDGLISIAECWHLWQQKNVGKSAAKAHEGILVYLARLEQRRPLSRIADPTERLQAETLRRWYRNEFCLDVERE